MRSRGTAPERAIEAIDDDLRALPIRSHPPLKICLLGGFRVLKREQLVRLRPGGKADALLSTLALRNGQSIAREAVLDAVWPNVDPQLASQSLSSLSYGLHRLLSDAIGGATVLVQEDGTYRLNHEAGVSVDVDDFLRLATAGDRWAAKYDQAKAAESFARAVDLYRGDLSCAVTVHHVVQRERLRAICLTLLARLADYHHARWDFTTSLEYATRLLSIDPCREDAHRMVMRCHVHRGERAQALRQYRVCEQILQSEFDAVPEEATHTLFNQIRLDPSSV
jgi:DNA-binding SARP family transcriptional activator